MTRRRDVLALVIGLLLSGVALLSLWLSFSGSIDWQLFKIVAPLTLVVVGVIGLTASRNRE